MQRPVLSICIPTYNSADYLSVTLDSIVCQFKDQDILDMVEVVISDNDSPDDTFQTVQKYQAKYNNIHYFKNETNLGGAVNVIKVAEHARGTYLRLITDNDSPTPFAIEYILKIIHETDFDLMIWNYTVEGEIKTKDLHENYMWYHKFHGIGEFSKFFWDQKKINLHAFGSNFSLYSIFFFKKEYFDYSKGLIDKNKLRRHYFPHSLIAFSNIEDKVIIKPDNTFTVIVWHYSKSWNNCKKVFRDLKEVFASFMWSKKITKEFRFKARKYLFRYRLINYTSSILNRLPFIKRFLRIALRKNNLLWKLINSIFQSSV